MLDHFAYLFLVCDFSGYDKRQVHRPAFYRCGDSIGIRTRVAAVRGRSLNRLTIEPYSSLIILHFLFFSSSFFNFPCFMHLSAPFQHINRFISPQAIIFPELPDGCVVKSSGFACTITVLPIISSTQYLFMRNICSE